MSSTLPADAGGQKAQVLYHLNRRDIERDLRLYCQKHEVPLIASTPLNDGRLATRSRFRRNRCMRALEQVATETQKTLARWLNLVHHAAAAPLVMPCSSLR
ncbi:hypothetical protein NKDENANG_00061 [Candidatus Entotheonellaceae bacterium PAL068K]